MSQNFLLIDGSYFVFFRYYALLNWFKLAKKDQIIDKDNPPWENKEFVEKFKKTFVSKVAEIKQKLKIDNPITLIGKDCPRKTIWRMKYLSSYKANRVYDDSFLGGPFFKMAYEKELFIKGGGNKIFKFPTLEADDCLAILSKRLLKSFPDANITIITSDMDYLQLANDNIQLYDLKYKKLTERKSSFNNAEKDLFVKILTGDKSDNIPSVLPKCGMKTASKFYNNKELFEDRLNITDGARERYERNKLIIDFDRIPIELINNFKETNEFLKY